MGWFWGASTPAQAPPSLDAPADPPAQAPSAKAAAPPSARESDTEVHKFLEELMGEVKNTRDADQAASSSPPPPPPSSAPKPSSSWASRWASSSSSGRTPTTESTPEQTTAAGARLSPLAESLLPTSMDCEQAFNMAYYCQSLGGQWNNVYRYGDLRSCSELWNDFFFCMRAKGTPAGKVKEDMIKEHYRGKLLAKYGPGKPSSEDVWQERKERVAPDEAFALPVEPPQVDDVELQKWEMARMERIRKGLKDEEAQNT